MNIKNKTDIKAKELTGIITKSISFINPAITLSITIVLAILTLSLAILNIIAIPGFTNVFPTISAIFMCIFIVLYSLPKTFAKTLLKQKNELKQDLVFDYLFLTSTFEVDSNINNETNHSTFTYNSLYNVKIKKNYTLLYLTKADVLVVKHDGFNKHDKDIFIKKITNYKKKKG